MLNEILINKSNLINNIKQVRLNNPRSLICSMVKANAYGVGLKEVVKILNDYTDFYGVACFFEAKQLSRYTNKKILIVGALEKKIDDRYSYSCHSLEDVKFLKSLNKPVNIHLKINTGMNRYGFSSVHEFIMALNEIKNSWLNLEGIFTHFATSDDLVKKQMKNFLKYVKVCREAGFSPLVHADNSSVNERYNHHLDMVRIGFDLYNRNNEKLSPVVQIKSRIVQVNNIKSGELIGYDYRCVADRKMKVAVIPIGYADGFDLRYIGLFLYLGGKMCRVLNVCMDCFMLDISDVNIKKGDSISLVDTINPLKIYAEYSHTSEYEVMTKFSFMRAKRLIV